MTSDKSGRTVTAASFCGTIETKRSAAAVKEAASHSLPLRHAGFASARSPELPPIPLDLYNAIKLRVRSDGRPYLCSIKTGGDLVSQEDDLYQALLQAETPGEWEDMVVPFGNFVLTWRGSVQPQQPYFNASRVASIGFGIADRQPGGFRLDVASIAAVRVEGRAPGAADR